MKTFLLKWREWSNHKYLPLVIILITAICMFFLIIDNVKEKQYDIKLFQLSPETIRSVKTTEDTVKTKEEREKVEKNVLAGI